MSSLQNLQINDTFPGLIKTNDEAAITGTLKTLQDGAGNNLPIEVSTTGVNFTGTVTGIPVGGVQSIIAGTNITVDDTDPFNPIVSASGGGGGGNADLAEGQNITTGFGTAVYSMPWVLSGYSVGAAKYMAANRIQFVPFYAKSGESISEFYVRVQTAVPAALMNIGLYKSYVSIASGNKMLYPEYVAPIALDVNISTTGKKLFTGLNILLPTDAYGGQYWIGFISNTNGTYLTKWINWVAAERSIYSDIYRANGTELQLGSFELPTGQINLSVGAQPTTDLCVDFAWKYKA
jgi:hypothetical protein